jgi:hypothetical protein
VRERGREKKERKREREQREREQRERERKYEPCCLSPSIISVFYAIPYGSSTPFPYGSD